MSAKQKKASKWRPWMLLLVVGSVSCSSWAFSTFNLTPFNLTTLTFTLKIFVEHLDNWSYKNRITQHSQSQNSSVNSQEIINTRDYRKVAILYSSVLTGYIINKIVDDAGRKLVRSKNLHEGANAGRIHAHRWIATTFLPQKQQPAIVHHDLDNGPARASLTFDPDAGTPTIAASPGPSWAFLSDFSSGCSSSFDKGTVFACNSSMSILSQVLDSSEVHGKKKDL